MSTFIVMIVSIYSIISIQLSNVIGTKLFLLMEHTAQSTCTTEDTVCFYGEKDFYEEYYTGNVGDILDLSDQDNGFMVENTFNIIWFMVSSATLFFQQSFVFVFVLCILCIIPNISPNQKIYIPSRPLMNFYLFLTFFCLESICVVISQTPPPNDQCSSAQCITVPSVITATTVGASWSELPFCGTFSTAPDIWFAFTAECNCVTVSTCGATTDYDTKLSLFGGCCDSLCCITGNDDDFSSGCGFFRSTISTCDLTIGDTYYIVLHGFSSATGTAEVSVTYVHEICSNVCEVPGPAACSTPICSDASPVCVNPVLFTICHNGATLSISTAALQAHLAHGDTMGACPGDTIVTICHKGKTSRVSEKGLEAYLAYGDTMGACSGDTAIEGDTPVEKGTGVDILHRLAQDSDDSMET